MNMNFFEAGNDIVPDFLSTDANTDIVGDWVKVSDYDRAYLVLSMRAGTAGDDLSINLRQATTNAGGSAKGLVFSKLWHKVGTLNAVPRWTAVELTTPTDDLDLVSVNGADLGADNADAVVVVEVMADSLDVNNGFRFVQLLVEGDDAANAKLATAHWLLFGGKYPQAIPLSALS